MQSPPASYIVPNEDQKEELHIVQQNYVNQQQAPQPQPVFWSNQNQPQPSEQGCPQVLYACTPPPPATNGYQNYKGTQSIWNGVLQILIGLLCIGFNAALIEVGQSEWYQLLEFISYGIWGGVVIIIAGSFGIAAGARKSKCLIVAFLVLSCVSCFMASVIFSLSTYNVVFSSHDKYDLITALNGVLLTLSVIEAAVGIWGSVLCCSAACCCSSSTPPMYLSPTPNQFNQGNTRIIIVDNIQALNPARLQQIQQGYPVAPVTATVSGYPVATITNF